MHLFGGDGKYVKTNVPKHIVFYCWLVMVGAVVVYSNNVDVKVNYFFSVIADGFNKSNVFTNTDDLL